MRDYIPIEKLLHIYSYDDFKIEALQCLLGDEMILKEVTLFFETLSHVKDKKLNLEEKLILSRVFMQCAAAQKHILSGQDFIKAALHLKEKLGLTPFVQLFEASVPKDQYNLDYFTIICHLLVDVSERVDVEARLVQCLPSLSGLIEVLFEDEAQIFNQKYKEKPLEEAIEAFRKEAFPLDESALRRIKDDYLKIQEFTDSLKKFSLSDLAKGIKIAGEKLKGTIYINETTYALIAHLRELFLRKFKMYPHVTQILAVLTLLRYPKNLKGRMLQMRMGEGKSLINTLVSAYFVCKGHLVDVTTSNRYLAVRDQLKFKQFFELIGFRSSHICYHNPDKKHFNAEVIYGVNTDFEFAVMKDEFWPEKNRYTEVNGRLAIRPFDVSIVDEGDNLFLNAALNSARLSIPKPRDESKSWVYEPILNYVKSRGGVKVDVEHIQALRLSLKQYNQGQFAKQVDDVTDETLKEWVKNANVALYHHHRNEDYIVTPQERMTAEGSKMIPQVVIVDKQTGELNSGSRWSGGLHEFVEVKEGLEPESESFTFTAESHPSYFSRYNHLFGLTGTGGEKSEREEINATYQIDIVDVPPHRPNQRITYPLQYHLTESAYYKAVLDQIDIALEANRPVLLLSSTIADSMKFSALLDSKKYRHLMINEIQREDENFVIERAGLPKSITVATNKAGRGTDIIITRQCNDAGGLHVIFTFFTQYLRDEDQGVGRGARQGDQGSSCIVLYSEEASVKQLIPNAALRNSMMFSYELLSELRTRQTEIISARRMAQVKNESIYHGVCAKISPRLQHLYQQIDALPLTEIIEALRELKMDAASVDPQSSKHPIITPLWRDRIKQLLALQTEGVSVDWKPFLQNLKEAYITYYQETWGRFFTRLESERRKNDLVVEQEIHECYEDFVNKKMHLALTYTQADFLTILSQLTGKVFEVVLRHPEESLVLMKQMSAYHQKLEAKKTTQMKSHTLFSPAQRASKDCLLVPTLDLASCELKWH